MTDVTKLGDDDSDDSTSAVAGLTEDEGYKVSFLLEYQLSDPADQISKQLYALNECGAAECSRCSCPLLEESHDGEVDKQEICRFWDCQCFICPDCSEAFEKAVEESEEDGKYKCPETDVSGGVFSIF